MKAWPLYLVMFCASIVLKNILHIDFSEDQNSSSDIGDIKMQIFTFNIFC